MYHKKIFNSKTSEHQTENLTSKKQINFEYGTQNMISNKQRKTLLYLYKSRKIKEFQKY